MPKTVWAALGCLCLLWSQDASPPANAAQMQRLGERLVDWPQQESDLRPDPAARYGKLANGLRYVIMANHTPSQAVSVRLRINVGSLMEAEDQRGLAHFLEHMVFNGSEHVPEGEMVHILERHGLAFGADTNAYTSFNETVYQLEAPRVDDEELDTVFFLLRETASRLTISPAAVDRERGVILSEERSRNTPAYRSENSQWNYFFPSARFSQRMPIGLTDVVTHASAQRIRDLYETYYRPQRALLIVVGDIDPVAIETRIRNTFGDWQAIRPDPGDPDLGRVSQPQARAGYFFDPGLSPTIDLASVRPANLAPNDRARYHHDLLRLIANSVMERRLDRLSRTPDAHFEEGHAGSLEMYKTADLTELELTARPEDWRAALGVGEQELRRALRYGFTQPELDEQVARWRTAYRTAAQQASTRQSRRLADEIASDFDQWEVFMAPSDELALFESLAPDLTPANVSAAFREQWGRGQASLFLSTNQAVENATAKELAAYAASQRTPVSAPVSTSTQSFAYTDFGAPGQVAETHIIDDLGITEVRFANNIRLNIKHTDFAHDAVLVSVRFGGGLLELPKSEPGLNFLFSSLDAAGLKAHSANDLERLFAGHNVGVDMSVGSNAFAYSAATTPADLQLELQLLAAYLTHPGYRPEGLAQFRQGIETQFQTLAATPDGVAQRDAPKLIRAGDPRYGIPAEPELLARNFDELRAALARASSNGAMEIGIVGDIDVNAVTGMVARTFGALPAREAAAPAFAEARAVAFPAPAQTPVILHHAGAANRAMALIYWPTTDDADVKRGRTLDLLSRVFELKLIERVREAEGATYSPSAQSFTAHVNPGYGYLSVSLDLVPANVNRFFGIVDDIAASLAAGDISADEVERARRPALEEFEHGLENNRYWLRLLATAQSDPDILIRHRSVESDYQSITVADLRAAAGQYLRRDHSYRIAILPP